VSNTFQRDATGVSNTGWWIGGTVQARTRQLLEFRTPARCTVHVITCTRALLDRSTSSLCVLLHECTSSLHGVRAWKVRGLEEILEFRAPVPQFSIYEQLL